MTTLDKPQIEASDFDRFKLKREIIVKQIDYRREKRWRIFSWTSSVLLAGIAGVIALTGRGFHFPPWPHKVLSATTIGFITLYAVVWMTQNRRKEEALEDSLKRLDESVLGVADSKEKQGREFPPLPLGYRVSVLITGTATVLLIIFV